jgi:peptide/nickel transport system permease protein
MFRGYLIKRIATTLIIFFVILNFQFVFFWVINPIQPVQWVIHPGFNQEVVNYLRKLYGLDDPLHVQYIKYITNMLTLSFGISFVSRRPVTALLIEYLPNTLALVLTAAIVQIVIGILAGLYAAAKRGKIADFSITGLGLIMYAIPAFVFSLAFRYIFAEKLHWFPVIGIPHVQDTIIAYLAEYMYCMALPLISLIIMGFGSWAFLSRNLSMDVLTQDFIQTARAKGVGEKKMLFKHVFFATLPPLLTLVVISLPETIFGALMTEYIFTWKGIGWWYLKSMWGGDYPVVQALFFIYTVMLLAGNLVADILYGFLDPRVRVGMRR